MKYVVNLFRALHLHPDVVTAPYTPRQFAQIQAGQIKSTQDANADLGKVKEAVHGMEAATDAINERLDVTRLSRQTRRAATASDFPSAHALPPENQASNIILAE